MSGVFHHDDRQVIGPNDQAFLVAVGVEPWLTADLTGSIEELRKGVERIRQTTPGPVLGEPCPAKPVQGRVRIRLAGPTVPGCGGTALWNAVYSAAQLKMKKITGRKALIVLSDGWDTGSTHSLSDAIEAAQSAETVVYTLHSYDPSMAIVPQGAKLMVEGNRHLTQLAEETGGRPFPSDGAGRTFAQSEAESRNLYVIGFTNPGDAQDGMFHKLELKAERKEFTVRARKGYFARSSGDQ